MEEDKVIFTPGPFLIKIMDIVARGIEEGETKIATDECIFGLAREIDKLKESTNEVAVETGNKEIWRMSDKERKFMTRFGWGMEDCRMIKRDIITGKVLAHVWDETWVRDLKVAGE